MRPPPTRARWRPRALRLAAVGLLAALGCTGMQGEPQWVGVPAKEQVRDADRVRFARQQLERGRESRRRGDLDWAERSFRRGLEVAPESPALLRELAGVLEPGDRAQEAAELRQRADAIDPPPPPLSEAPVDTGGLRILVILLPPSGDAGRGVLQTWPDGPVDETLERRLRTRLPGAKRVHAEFETVSAARQWIPQYAPDVVLALRVERFYCGDTVKDGKLGVATLRAGIARAGRTTTEPIRGRALLRDPRHPEGCSFEATARALDRVLASDELREALAGRRGAPGRLAASWTTPSIRTLFPELGEAIDAELAEGHRLLGLGNLEGAVTAFRRAAHIDATDPVVVNYLREADSVLAMSRELSQRNGEAPSGQLDPRLTAAQRSAMETQLREERRRRDDLLTALAVMDEDLHPPSPTLLQRLRPVEIRDPDAFGPSLARRRAGGDVEARSAYAPDGSIIARYYFPVGESRPVVREEDTSGDGVPDRWIAYTGETRSELWEDGRASGRPDVRLVFAESGSPLLRIELDQSGDGEPDRIFHYAEGTLSAEARDSDGDGRLDTFDRFDADGNLGVREEDVDGDGGIDVRSYYEGGKLIRRELSTTDALSRRGKPKGGSAHVALD
jgi:hypothetical protein